LAAKPVPGELVRWRSSDTSAHSPRRLGLTHSVAYDPAGRDSGGALLTRTGFIDHIGIGVPDLVAAKEYYDDLMSVLGLREWFETGPGGPLNYGPMSGLEHVRPSSSTNPASSPNTGRTVLRPTGLIPMDSNWRRSATAPKGARSPSGGG